MNTKLIAAVVGVVIVAGAGYYLYTSSNNGGDMPGTYQPSGQEPIGNDDAGSPQGSSDDEITATGRFTGTMAQLAARGGDYKCTFNTATAVGSVGGTVYVSKGKVRGDFKTVAQGVPVESHMLQMNDYVYMWTTIAPTGVKVRVSPAGSDTTYQGTGQYADANASYTYDCQGWIATTATFDFPQGVTFTDATAN